MLNLKSVYASPVPHGFLTGSTLVLGWGGGGGATCSRTSGINRGRTLLKTSMLRSTLS